MYKCSIDREKFSCFTCSKKSRKKLYVQLYTNIYISMNRKKGLLYLIFVFKMVNENIFKIV